MERFICRDLRCSMIYTPKLETTLMFSGWLNRTVAHSHERTHTIKNDIAEEYLMTWENDQDLLVVEKKIKVI